MQKFIYFIGIDISKQTLDFSLVQMGNQLFHLTTANNPKGIACFIKKLKDLPGFEIKQALFCMEHTGIYNHFLLEALTSLQANICLQAAIQIKYSLGLQRGKNDKIDAKRIALYAYLKRDTLELWQPPRPVMKRLKYLVALRNRLIRANHQLKTALAETAHFSDKTSIKELATLCKSSLLSLAKDEKKATKAIEAIIKSDQKLNHLFTLITSVKGVGQITATQIILSTNEFNDIKEGKKFAAYAGVVPYEHSSGSSIRGKNRTSKMANQSMKTLLHMAALCAIVHCSELKAYYERKVGEGKNKMAVINAVRNKLVLRIFACVKNNRQYSAEYLYQATSSG
ncbi:IS110 family transposase [Rhodocytophaga aerolata]|uniref:IS110 family transposase n=1 Tax=Rhodocytophaga aerolata TaxID=455078 RepID=A0ABT8RD94_9BACT|nr:IS110 family transposase [Rhodocytophaga aerolata]MDO1449173.1 IS110 family transposase [Rhodocytophaga aerolata]